MSTVECSDCGNVYSENEKVCPACGSTKKTVFLSPKPISLELGAEISGMKAKNDNYTGKKKTIWEWKNKKTVRGDNGKPVRRYTHIDRENDWYEEVVTDLTTGEVIHECKEPLSEHRGHGSAKNKT